MSLARSSGPFAPKASAASSAFLKAPRKAPDPLKAWDGTWPEPAGAKADPVVEGAAWRLAMAWRAWPESQNERWRALQIDLYKMIDEMFFAAYHPDAKARMKAIAARMLQRFDDAKVLEGKELMRACENIFIREMTIPKAFRR